MTDRDLKPDIDSDGNVDHMAAIMRLYARLEVLAPDKEERRGHYLREFLKEDKYKRRPAERMAEWLPRWHEGVERLREDGVDLAGLDTLAGWCLMEHANISEHRLEMVRNSVKKLYDLSEIETALRTLFPQVHRGAERTAPRVQPRRSFARRRPLSHQVRAAECYDEDFEKDHYEENDFEEEDDFEQEAEEEDEPIDPAALSEVFQTELRICRGT